MRCRVRFACGHYKSVYIDQGEQDWHKRFDVLEHMRCEDCRLAACCKLVTMRYADYKNHCPACPTAGYDKEAKTIGVYVPDDYLENGASSVDWRAEEVRAAVAIVKERHSAKPWPPFRRWTTSNRTFWLTSGRYLTVPPSPVPVMPRPAKTRTTNGAMIRSGRHMRKSKRC